MKSNYFSTIRRIIFSNMILVPLIPFILALGTDYYVFTRSSFSIHLQAVV